MPLYEYSCQACESLFDALRPMDSADDPIACPSCGSARTNRKLSVFAAHSDGKALAGSTSCYDCTSGQCAHCQH